MKTPEKVTDQQLRAAIDEGLTPSQVAERYDCSRQAVAKRLRKLQLTTTGAMNAPEESRRFVAGTLDAMEQLTRSIGRVNLLFDACDTWLRDAEDPDRYDVGPRADEVFVTYEEDIGQGDRVQIVRRKARLSALLARCVESGAAQLGVVATESKYADPRELVLKTAQEVRQTVGAAADLARMLADARAMEAFRSCMLAEIEKVSPEVARAIAEAVRRSIVLSAAAPGCPALPAAGEPA